MERDEKREYLIALRESTGMTRKDFAIEYQIPYPTITDWELGHRRVPEYFLRLLAYNIDMSRQLKNDTKQVPDKKKQPGTGNKHEIGALPAWERLFKKIVWKQLGTIKGKRILDFGSGEGITANYFAADNDVTAIEPSEEMLQNRWKNNSYTQIIGDISALKGLADESFDIIICHNVLEYIDDKKEILCELNRVLKQDGMISLVKHNRAGRVMQMAVLLDDTDKANSLLDGENSTASKFGTIRYYEDDEITAWVPELRIVDCYGVRTFFDLQQNQEKHGDDQWQEKMMELEMRVSQIEEYRDIAFFHHLIIKHR